jgi:hypothetical protein
MFPLFCSTHENNGIAWMRVGIQKLRRLIRGRDKGSYIAFPGTKVTQNYCSI